MENLSVEDNPFFIARDFDPSKYVSEAIKCGTVEVDRGRADHALRAVKEQIKSEVMVKRELLLANLQRASDLEMTLAGVLGGAEALKGTISKIKNDLLLPYHQVRCVIVLQVIIHEPYDPEP